MNHDTPQLREQLLAAIRADPFSTTDELAAVMPWQTQEGGVTCTPSSPHWHHEAAQVALVSCRAGRHRWRVPRRGPDIYRHLRFLEQAGLCYRVQVPGERRVRWLPNDVDGWRARLDELEASWAAGP